LHNFYPNVSSANHFTSRRYLGGEDSHLLFVQLTVIQILQMLSKQIRMHGA
jgi:hypothetical protein